MYVPRWVGRFDDPASRLTQSRIFSYGLLGGGLHGAQQQFITFDLDLKTIKRTESGAVLHLAVN